MVKRQLNLAFHNSFPFSDGEGGKEMDIPPSSALNVMAGEPIDN